MTAAIATADPDARCIAFAGPRRIAAGPLAEVARAVKAQADSDPDTAILVFDAVTSARVELDLRGTAEEVVARLFPPAVPEEPRRVGRPKLGVVSREISLLPRHWDWLASQPGGASVTLRRLVEEARRAGQEQDRARLARDAAHRFVTVMAGDLAGYEEAMRAFYANDKARFTALIAAWPRDIRDHAAALAGLALGAEA